MASVQKGNVHLAHLEALRLQSYFEVYAAFKQLSQKKFDAKVKWLTRMFNAVAKHTSNTILSEFMIMPDGSRQALLPWDTTEFSHTVELPNHRGQVRMGFYQVPMNKPDRWYHFALKDYTGEPYIARKSYTSIPFLGLDKKKMELMDEFQPETMLKCFQEVASAGNHDMIHHYSNRSVNQSAADTENRFAKKFLTKYVNKLFNNHLYMNRWFGGSFVVSVDDTNSLGYEAWLMLIHADIRADMEKGPEGKKLWQACDIFFDELTRIGRDMAARDTREARRNAQYTVDYMGTTLCYTLMRFIPLNHPLMDHAVTRLIDALPDQDAYKKQRRKILSAAHKFDYDTEKALQNYDAIGLKLRTEKPDMHRLKKLELIMLAPWITHLLSPPRPGTELEKAKLRAHRIGHDLMIAVEKTDTVSGRIKHALINSVKIFFKKP